MKKLNEVKFPKDFTKPETAVLRDRGINELIKLLKAEPDYFIASADTLVILTDLGYVEVYKLGASCEVEVDW